MGEHRRKADGRRVFREAVLLGHTDHRLPPSPTSRITIRVPFSLTVSALPPRKRWRRQCESNGARSDRGLSTSDGSRPPTLPRSAALIPITRSTERTGTPSSATLGQSQVSPLR